MPVNVQSMLDELREEMSSFEGSLPEISDLDALDGLLGIKHVLFQRWEEEEKALEKALDERRRTGGHWWKSVSLVEVATWIYGAFLIGPAIVMMVALGCFIWYVVPFLVAFVLVSTVLGVLGLPTPLVVAAGAVAGLVAVRIVAWETVAAVKARAHRVLSKRRAKNELRTRSRGLLDARRDRLESDPIFLIDEVQAFVKEQIDTAHSRFSKIRTEFEKAVIRPRKKAETTLVMLRQKRLDALGRQFPDEGQILAQIDKYIAECERLLAASFDEKQVAKQLQDTGEQLRALYRYPALLEQVKAAYQSQADFVADLDDVGVDIDGIQSSRSTTMMAVASQLRDLRGEIGLANRLLEGFGGYLAAQPELAGVLVAPTVDD